MAEEIPKEAKEVPRFRVTMPPGFFDGVQLHEVGTELDWTVPEGWSAAKNGPHPMSRGPSQSFVPLNEAARMLQDEHRQRIAKSNEPKESRDDARLARMEEVNLQLMEVVLGMRAEQRRRDDAAEQAEDEKKRKK